MNNTIDTPLHDEILILKNFNYNYKRSLAIVDVLTMFDDAISTEVILEMYCSRTP